MCNLGKKCTDEGVIKKKLALAQQTGTLIGIYNDKENTRAFFAGFICAMDNEFVLLAHVQSGGLYDGFILLELSSIYRIEKNTLYLQKIERLYAFNNQHHLTFIQKTLPTVQETLSFAKENSFVVSIQLLRSGYDDVIGIVKELEGEHLTINELDEYGKSLGEVIVDIRTITQIACDTEDEHPIGQLINLEK